MKIIYKTVFLFILIPFVGFSFHENKDFKKEKTISKTFEVANDASLNVTNSYGNVNVYLWDENKISIQTIIKVSGNSETKVTEKLNEINVDFSSSINKVAAITTFSGKNGSGKNNLNFEINYIIKIPKNGNVSLVNKYGNISIDKLYGNLTIDCKYGSLNLGQLYGKSNNFTIAYSQNSTIANVEKLQLKSQYSDIEFNKVNQINIDGNYNSFTFQAVENLNLSSNYTKIKALSVAKSSITGNYLTLKLGEIKNATTINSNYSDIQLLAIKNTNSIAIHGNYTNSKISCTSDFAFDFKIALKYGSFKDNLGIKFTDKSEKNNSKSYTGYHINQGKSSINVTTNYGNIQLLNQ